MNCFTVGLHTESRKTSRDRTSGLCIIVKQHKHLRNFFAVYLFIICLSQRSSGCNFQGTWVKASLNAAVRLCSLLVWKLNEQESPIIIKNHVMLEILACI